MSRLRSAWDSIVAWPHLPRLIEAMLLALILADFARVVARLIGVDATLHWDESVYAVRARSWVDPDAPLSGWSHIRPPLLPLVATIPVLAGGDEWQLRSLGLIGAIGLLLASWWLARLLAGPVAGVAAVAVLATGPSLLRESGVMLTDVPSAAMLVVVVALLWRELELRERPGPGLVLAAAIAVAAFFMRYGSLVALAPVIAMSVIFWWRRLASAPRLTIVAVAIGVAAAVGHVSWSLLQTGSPLGVLLDAQAVVPPDISGDPPLDEYLRYVDFLLVGEVGQLAILASLAAVPLAVLISIVDARWRRPARGLALVMVTALAHVALLTRGVGHAEERYFVFSAALLVVAGVSIAALLVRLLPMPARVALIVAGAVLVVANRGPGVEWSFDSYGRAGRADLPYELAGLAIAEASGPDCGIITGGDPIVAWYSRCETERLRLPPQGGSVADALMAEEKWLVLYGGYDIDLDASPVREAMADVSRSPLRITDPVTGDVVAWAWRFADR
ncbi:MAG: hypothetical protein ACRDGD_10035 [Candidatus Limnocylindria bacterium]